MNHGDGAKWGLRGSNGVGDKPSDVQASDQNRHNEIYAEVGTNGEGKWDISKSLRIPYNKKQGNLGKKKRAAKPTGKRPKGKPGKGKGKPKASQGDLHEWSKKKRTGKLPPVKKQVS